MERAIVRMHFDDDTFKTFLLVPTTTAGDLVAQVQQKLKTDSPYYLYYSAPGVAGILTLTRELPSPLPNR